MEHNPRSKIEILEWPNKGNWTICEIIKAADEVKIKILQVLVNDNKK